MNLSRQAPIKIVSLLAFLWMVAGCSTSSENKGTLESVVTSVLEYQAQGKTFEGLVVRPPVSFAKPAGGFPSILMIHNWMGVSGETRKQAERFAREGFVVLAVDVYGKGIRPQDPKSAGAEATKYKSDRQLLRERLQVGLQELQKLTDIDPKQISAAGYCFGGTAAIELARSGAPIVHAISFHGGLDSPTPRDGKNIRSTVTVFHGLADPFVPQKDIAAFESEMRRHKVRYQRFDYPGVVHSFTDVGAGTDTSKGAAYNEAADLDSFAKALTVLRSTLSP
jgi:dienelactone hydrolase